MTAFVLLFACTIQIAFGQSRTVPARLIYLVDERPVGELHTFASGEAGCAFAYQRRLAQTVASSNWTRTWNECGQTFTHTNTLTLTGAPYWTYQANPNLPDLGRARIEHVWLDDRPVAAITYTYTGTATTPTTTSTSYVETDHLATPRLITNASRQKRWSWDSAPYGDTLPIENPQALGVYKYNLRFPGQYFDAETNHHYNHHRDYESTTGRICAI